MWTRKELKERAKEALKRNYWKAVMVALLIVVLGGGAGSAASGSSMFVTTDQETHDIIIGEVTSDTTFIMENEGAPGSVSAADLAENVGDKIEEDVRHTLENMEEMNAVHVIVFALVIIVFAVIFATVAVAIDVFLINPLVIGTQRFMLKCVDDKGNIADLGYTFDHNYKNGVKTAFFRELYTFLWALLFIIPGIYKKYQYYLVDYILAENPDMPYKEVLERSKTMMDGQKWNTFVLDLSFILWHMLSFVTCGLSEIFYVRPYLYLTRASLYRALCTNGYDMAADME